MRSSSQYCAIQSEAQTRAVESPKTVGHLPCSCHIQILSSNHSFSIPLFSLSTYLINEVTTLAIARPTRQSTQSSIASTFENPPWGFAHARPNTNLAALQS